jgi:ABC-type multidrug transport system fused ATPase/permease subunit
MAVRSGSFIIVVIVALWLLSRVMTSVVLLALIPTMIFMFIFGKQRRKISKARQEANATMTTSAEESFSNVRTVKAFSNEAWEIEKFGKGN